MRKQSTPDVVLLDIGLPKINDIEACKIMRGDGLEKSLIIATTGYGHDLIGEASSKAGFDLHLIKPVDLDMLRGAILRWSQR